MNYRALFSSLVLAPIALVPFALGCSDAALLCSDDCPPSGTTIAMDFSAASGFYGAPFPSDTRTRADGTVDLAGFPNPKSIALVQSVVDLLDAKPRGFGLTSGVFFQASAPLDPASLPDVHGSIATDSPVILIGADSKSPDYLKRYPVASYFTVDGGLYGSPNLLTLLPLQGIPLRPRARYAAIVRTSLRDANGAPLDVAPAVAKLVSGGRPDGMSDAAFQSYTSALAAIGEAKIDPTEIAALTVFTTGSPEDDLTTVTAAMIAKPPAPDKAFAPNEVFDDFCVYSTTIGMPEYQGGVPPYSDSGGGWVFDSKGAPVLQRTEPSNFVVTIPRAAMPAAGYPMVIFSRTGGGGDRPLVDRGPQGVTNGPALMPGTGPALYFAKSGFAGASIDGPLGGLRNLTMGNEDFLIFNVANLVALRDNVRQSAAELALAAHIVESISIDVSKCPGAVAPGSMAHFDTSMMALMGHSMGATIAPLSLAVEPRFKAGLLSGAGGSWIENIIWKLQPLPVKGIAEVLLGLTNTGYSLTEYDSLLSLYQWAGEEADPPVYGRRIIAEPLVGSPRHVLMMQGIVDHYILPAIADATSLSFGLDLVGKELDENNPAIAQFTPVGTLLDLTGRAVIPLPAAANVKGAGGALVTAVVSQHPGDGIEDGHEVVFQTDPPKHEYRCFLLGLVKGAPRVPSTGAALDPCD